MFTNAWFSQNKHYDIQPTQLYTQAGLISWETTRKSNTEFPLKTMHFLEVRRFKTPTYTVYDYTASGQIDLQSTYSINTFLYNICIYLFIIQ
jgi:hypothetical protein